MTILELVFRLNAISIESLHSHICRTKQGKVNRKRDIKNKRWCRLYKIEEDE